MAAGNSTYHALLARGIDSGIAEELRDGGYTLRRLKGLSDVQLEELGIAGATWRRIRAGKRPPIPVDTVVKLVHEARRTCCVCRNPTRAFVIHHIEDWSTSRSHAEANLALLCLLDHDAAHTTHESSVNLSPEQVRGHKQLWLEEVKRSDIETLSGRYQVDGARWDYVNTRRLFELLANLGIQPEKFRRFRSVRESGLVDSQGALLAPGRWPDVPKPKSTLYDFGGGDALYLYVKSLLEKALTRLPAIDITSRWSKTEVRSLVAPGDFFTYRGATYFRELTSKLKGRNRTREGCRKATGICVRFSFDAWQTTSTSALCYLKGRRRVMPILHVRNITPISDRSLVIDASCLAIGCSFKESPKDRYVLWQPTFVLDPDREPGEMEYAADEAEGP